MAVQVKIYVNYNFFVSGYAPGCHKNPKPENYPQLTQKKILGSREAVQDAAGVTGRLLIELCGGMAGSVGMEVVLVVRSLMGLCLLYINGQKSLVSSHSPGQAI